ncbi:S-layer homology domain-containing protein [Paenibacillus thermotolerans]|uniref:S-layer homology domain-containing protein n=1 Tax=Paenibacillus thermotolerans TaxID=3027807 RepID=UPI002367642D|nr:MULTISPECIES: S-layer homology domain-containing protein [unclassified Paenibacillus]
MSKMSRKWKQSAIAALCAAVLMFSMSFVRPASADAELIYNQDGAAFSGLIEAQPLGAEIRMTGYAHWPSEVGKGRFSFVGGVYDGRDVWMIPFNESHVVKVDGSTGDMTAYGDWPAGLSLGTDGFFAGSFLGGVYDGEYVWMIPYNASHVVRLDPVTGEMTAYDNWPDGFVKGNHAFSGGVFDGEYVWMIPAEADRVIRLDADTGEMAGYMAWPDEANLGVNPFVGGVFDGRSIWMIPYDADQAVKLDTQTGSMTGYADWPAGFAKGSAAFASGVFDGDSVWLIPYNADQIVKIHTATGEMTSYDRWPDGVTKTGGNTFRGGAFDGSGIWMFPYTGIGKIVRADAATGEMTAYDNWPDGTDTSLSAFASGVFDGTNVWLVPYSADPVVKLSTKLPGQGTAEDPYRIRTIHQLSAIRDDLNAHYKLVADIDASGTASWNRGDGFRPIGDPARPFQGVFDGNGYTIAGLTIDRPAMMGVGLFGVIGEDGEVRNVGLSGGSVKGWQLVGGIAGQNFGSIRNTFVTADVSSSGANVGGLVGWNALAGTVSYSYATGDVAGWDNVGGVAGQNNGTIDHTFMTGDVSGSRAVGGLVGRNEMYSASIIDSYAAGNVEGSSEVGGAVGRHIGILERTYAVGNVSGASVEIGALVGRNMTGVVTDSFYDSQTTGQGGFGTALTTAQMMQRASYGDAWDFEATWSIEEGEGYPSLRPALAAPTGVGAAADKDSIDIVWNDVELAHRYRVFVSTESGKYPGTPNAVVTDSSYSITDAVYGTTYYVAVQSANSMGVSGLSGEVAVALEDGTPPLLSITMKTASGHDYSEGAWTNESVTISVYAEEALSDIETITYRIGGGPELQYTEEAPIVLDEEGTHLVTIQVTDGAGNNTSDSVTVRIDKSPPTIVFDPNGSERWAEAASTNVTVADEASGVDASRLRYAWKMEEQTPSSGWASFGSGDDLRQSGADGDWYLHVQAVDLAGNVVNAVSNRYRLDTSSAVLWGLSVREGTLRPVFDAHTSDYFIGVGRSVTQLTIDAVPADASDAMTVRVNGGQSAPFANQPIALHSGNNTVELTVTALNGLEHTYTLSVVRDSSGPGSTGGSRNNDSSEAQPSNIFLIGLSGGTVVFEGGRIVIPSGAHAASFFVTVDPVEDTGKLPLDENERFASRVIELMKNVSGPFDREVAIEMEVAGDVLQEETMEVTLRWFDEARNKWVALDNNTVDWENGIVSGTTNHFTKFAAIARTVEAKPSGPQEGEDSHDDVHFIDIQGHWAETQIMQFVRDTGLEGYPDGTFGPDRTVSRAEFVTMLAKVFAWPSGGTLLFDDTSGHWAERSIAAAVAAGIVQGYDANTFAPDAPITREEMAVMAVRALRFSNGGSAPAPADKILIFADQAAIATWALEGLKAALDGGIIAGYADGTFRPKAHATRAEAVVVVSRVLRSLK